MSIENGYSFFKLLCCSRNDVVNRSAYEYGYDYVNYLIEDNFEDYIYYDNRRPDIFRTCGMRHFNEPTELNYNDMTLRYKLLNYDKYVDRISTCYYLVY